MGVSYSEEDGSPKVTFAVDGYKVTRRLICAWADRYELAASLFDTSFSITSTPRRVVYCNDCQIEPMKGKNTGSGSVSSYEKAILSASYESIKNTWETNGGDKLSETFEPATEYNKLPYEDLRWASAGGDPLMYDEAPGRPSTIMVYSITYYEQRKVPDDAFNYFDCVNSAAIVPKSEGLRNLIFTPETLRFDPPSLQHKVSSNGESRWNITYRFQYRPNYWAGTNYGWNYFWRPSANTYQTIYDKSGQRIYIFRPADFSGLLPS